MPVCPEYSFAGDSTYVSDSARPHRYYQHKPTPALESAPATPLFSQKSCTDVGVPRSRYFHGGHKNAHGPLCDKYSRRSRRRQSMYAALQLSHTSTNTTLPTSTILPQPRPVPTSPVTGLVLTPSPRDKELRTNANRDSEPSSICSRPGWTIVSVSVCLYVCLCDRYFLVVRAIWSMISCCVRLVVRT